VIVELLVLGFTLSLDNFRASIALGTPPFSLGRAVQVALMFGLWDGLAPLVGGLPGRYVGTAIEPIAEYVGPAVMGAYGLYLLVRAFRSAAPEELDHPWALFGIPLSLSLDNLIAGTSLGLLGVSPVLAAAIFAAIAVFMSFVMSFVGLCLGRAIGRLIPHPRRSPERHSARHYGRRAGTVILSAIYRSHGGGRVLTVCCPDVDGG
jgi:manganese efflux pump family protein